MSNQPFENLASLNDIPDEGVLGVRRSDGQRLCLIRSQGRVSAVANNCTHQDFEMSLGDVLPDGTIQCAWHGARFDCATGAVMQGPALSPLPVFEVRIEGQNVLVGQNRVSSQPTRTSASEVSPQPAISSKSAVRSRSS